MDGILNTSLLSKELSRGLAQLPILILMMGLFFTVGCEPSQQAKQETSQDELQFEDDQTAQEIFSAMVAKYRNADQYSDKAVLFMSYRLNGRPIQEPQPWAIGLDANGQFMARIFNTQVQCDGKLFSCYVYDIESGNLDDQRLVWPVSDKLPIEELYKDEIAAHFITGYADMPLDTSRPKETTRLIPPTIGLLTGQVEPRWLTPNVRLERFADSEIDGSPCFVVRCWASELDEDHVDLWVDQENSTLWQAAFPTDCLASKVRTSPDITELRMVARFNEASFEPKPELSFALKPRTSATIVSEFVKIPESLPSELIGRKAPKFELLTQSSRTLSNKEFLDKTTTLMWISGNPEIETLYEFDKLAKSIAGERQNYAIVYSEPHRANFESDVHAMNMALNEVARNTKMPFYYDQDLHTSSLLRVKAIPALVVLDKMARCNSQGR